MLYPTQFCPSNHESTVTIKSQLSEMFRVDVIYVRGVRVRVCFESTL